MRETRNQDETGGDRRRVLAQPCGPRESVDLQSIVVRYENRPDRCTVTPRARSDDERMTAWLSADLDAFVDLEEGR